MKKRTQRIMAMLLGAALVAGTLAGCGAKGGSGSNDVEDINTVGKSTEFTYMVNTAIPEGIYDNYGDNPVAAYWTSLEWDADGDGEGTTLDVDFWAPTAGSESDYVNTLISTGEYPDIMPLTFASEGATEMYNEGMVIDLTKFVEKYMPNYMAFVEAHPEIMFTNRVDGEDKYIQLYYVNEDISKNPWGGLMYRRDWIVNYGTNPQTGEPFSGEWADGEWVDNVVFPSGGTDPVYISDWEWMLDIFAKAIEAQGMTDGYALQLPYQGVHTTGDLASGFNTGVFFRYGDDGMAECSSASEGMRAYVECMTNWFKKGWVDPHFAERASDMFYTIDMASIYSGQVGAWYGLTSQLLNGLVGDGSNPWTANAVAYAAASPINDVYGDESVQNHEPDLFYQDSLIPQAFVITDKAADKDIATLLTAIDYFYSEEGSTIFSFGLSQEMLDEGVPGSENYQYGDGLDRATYTVEDDGTIVTDEALISTSNNGEVASGVRMVGMGRMNGIDRGYSQTKQHCIDEWVKYTSSRGFLLDVSGQLSPDDLSKYNAYNTNANTTIAQWIPQFIMGTYDVMDDADWQLYEDEIQALNPDEVIEALNDVLEWKN